ncbi:MAG TPA: hypothetical protein PK156_22325 [Polyangium sp.]|nr:hypothetical protein [Polyangium sp.]
MSIQLLLAREDGTPYLPDDGVPDENATLAIEKKGENEIDSFFNSDQNPNDLAEQRWGLVIADNDEGRRLAEVIAPLVALRREQQNGKPIKLLTAPVGMTAEQTGKWWANVYNAERSDNKKVDRPRYLLILGDPTQITWEAQERMAAGAYVGRLSFPKEADYEAYVAKLLAYERAAKKNTPKVRATFFTVRDGTAATGAGDRGLMKPTVDAARVGLVEKDFPAADITHLGVDSPVSPEEFLRAVESRDPRMLFTISHGLGTSKETAEQERLRIQGAMSFGSGKKITGDDIANRVFLPGGAWFFFACFSAGTPNRTAYRHWLRAMKDAGLGVRASDIDAVMSALPEKNAFVASLPQKALANPDGPLAVIGHVDLAWTFSFQDASKKWRSSRFHGVFRGLVDQSRIGPSFADLQFVLNDTNSDLTDMIDTEVRAKEENEILADAAERPAIKAGLWMLRQDLYAYVLLGDPAARIAGMATPEEVRRKVPSISLDVARGLVTANPGDKTAAADAAPVTFGATSGDDAPRSLASIDPERIESAVFASVSNEGLDALAKEYGVERSELDTWIDTYKQGGRAAVSKKSRD